MIPKIIIVSIAMITTTSQSVQLDGAQLAEAWTRTAKSHLGIPGSKRTSQEVGDGRITVYYESITGERFITYSLTEHGKLLNFTLNGANIESYAPLMDRRNLIEKMIRIAAPEISNAERIWAAKQMDGVWTRRVRPLPVQVAGYVFKGMTVTGANGVHDTIWVGPVSEGLTGLQYPLRPR